MSKITGNIEIKANITKKLTYEEYEKIIKEMQKYGMSNIRIHAETFYNKFELENDSN